MGPAIPAFYQLERDLLVVGETGQSGPLNRGDMDEDVLPSAIRLNESIPFRRVEPLHSSGRHVVFLRKFRRRESAAFSAAKIKGLAFSPGSLARRLLLFESGLFPQKYKVNLWACHMIEVLGLTGCDTCKKAQKSMRASGADVVLRDVRKEPLSAEDIDDLLSRLGERLLNTRSTTWRSLDEMTRTRSSSDLLAEYPALMKRPVIKSEAGVTLGWDEATEKLHLGETSGND